MKNQFFQNPQQLERYRHLNDLMHPEGQIFNKYIRPDQDVLDIGCGTGRTSAHLKPICRSITAFDVVPEMIDIAKQNHPEIDFTLADVCTMNYTNAFDVALFSFNGIDGIHPKERRLMALKRIFDSLRPGGYFIYSTHNKYFLPRNPQTVINLIINLFTLRIFRDYRLSLHRTGLLRYYYSSPEQEKRDLENVGFRWIEQIPLNTNGWSTKYFDCWTYYVFQKP